MADIFKIPDIKPEYDTVILGNILEHVFEPSNMIKRSLLSLIVGGKMIITTPWGYFPAPGHHQTFFLTNFLDFIPDELSCVHLSVKDGYIRFIGHKTHDLLTGQQDKMYSGSSIDLSERALLEITEESAMDG